VPICAAFFPARTVLTLPREAPPAGGPAWQLREYAAAADVCRAAAKRLKRRDAQPDVWDVCQLELAHNLLADGVLRLRLSEHDGSEPCGSGGGAERKAAVTALGAAAQAFQALGPRAANDAAVAHFHLGDALARAVLNGSSSGVGRAAAALPVRHLERALAFFQPAPFPADHARIRLKLAALTEALASGCVCACRRCICVLNACV
jgi:hypothetical protein